MKIINKNKRFGTYPCCDLINNAILFMLEDKKDVAITELIHTLSKSNGYMYDNVKENLIQQGFIKVDKDGNIIKIGK